MTYPLEKEGTIITDEEEFHKKFCETCKWKSICEEWEFKTGSTLYTNRFFEKKVIKLLVADDGTKGVFRCASYEGEK